MSDTHIEKAFLYLIAVSILLHVAVFALIAYLPQGGTVARQEPYMVELQDLPAAPDTAKPEDKDVRRLDEQRRRVPAETAPPGEAMRDKAPAAPPVPPSPVLPPPAPGKETGQLPAERGSQPVQPRAGGDFFKPKEQAVPDVAKLFPSSEKLASLEEGYRKRYGPEVREGEATFLNTDDLQFGSFLRRFESAVYGVWRYPAEAARMGIEGVTPVRITFNRNGEIKEIAILETSGSKILDEEVRRTLKAVGPIGGFPRAYDKETFNLIAFFHYGISRGQIRGTLH